MALIRPDFWIAPLPDFVLSLARDIPKMQHKEFRGASHAIDHAIPLLVGAFALGLQTSTLFKILVVHARQRDTRKYRIANAILGVTWLLAISLYIANVIFRIHSLALLKPAGGRSSDESIICGLRWCFEASNALPMRTRRLELPMSALMQLAILGADVLLLWRCSIIFAGNAWITRIVSGPFIVSVGSTVVGIVALTQRNDSVNAPDEIHHSLLQSYDAIRSAIGNVSSMISMGSSVLVNVLVTACILSRICQGRRRISLLERSFDSDLEDLSHTKCASKAKSGSAKRRRKRTKSYHNATSILLMETALPSATFGILACFVQPIYGFDMCVGKLASGRYTIRMLWLWFTVMAPQFILLRVMERRDAHTLAQIRRNSLIDVSDCIMDTAGSGLPPLESAHLRRTIRTS
ncbi:hypothetical protein NMY22_g7303 [Coprinellus aureogranulatus]|nr:hypothetical protein NMY22_g7303 [Coprinellus aureogranulatus]